MSAYTFHDGALPDGADGGAVGSAGGAVGVGTAGPGADDAAAGMLAGVWTMKVTHPPPPPGRGLVAVGVVEHRDGVQATAQGQFEGRPAALLYPGGDWMGPTILHLRAGGAKALQSTSEGAVVGQTVEQTQWLVGRVIRQGLRGERGVGEVNPAVSWSGHQGVKKEGRVIGRSRGRGSTSLIRHFGGFWREGTGRRLIQRGQKNAEAGAQRQQKKGLVVIYSRGSNVLSVITQDNRREGRQEEERERVRPVQIFGPPSPRPPPLGPSLTRNCTTYLVVKPCMQQDDYAGKGGVGGRIGGVGGGVIP
ncbi:hypothetical protein FB451DRAFT_1375104 [Mycena latifolia]|nr:hypothetical protein FB451DRAFT_1375104 [Mycena latifolia]